MICNCTMAGTAACNNCINNKTAGNDYDYSKWLHVDIPPVSQEQIDKFAELLKFYSTPETEIPEVKESVQDLNCNECKHYHRDIVNGIEFVNHNYCEKGVNVASPAFWCKWGEF